MIDRNIGKTERLLRLVLGIALISWVIGGATFGAMQGLALLAAFALLWNSVFGRCYLWKWLGFNSCDSKTGDCANPGSGNKA
jgi:hypothetical protein